MKIFREVKGIPEPESDSEGEARREERIAMKPVEDRPGTDTEETAGEIREENVRPAAGEESGNPAVQDENAQN